MKKKIIVPVDFSELSHNAFLFALSIAEDFDCEVEVIHFYSPLSHTMMFDHLKEEQIIDTLEEELNQFVTSYTAEDLPLGVMINATVKTKVLRGAIVPQLIERSLSKNTFMIIIGAKETTSRTKKLFGTIPSELSQHAFCPVMLIPPNASFEYFNNILIASSIDSIKPTMIDSVIELAEKYNSFLHFIHVSQNEEMEKDYLKAEKRLIKEVNKNGSPDCSVYNVTIKAPNIAIGISQYAEEYNADLIVLVNRNRGFLNNLFKESLSKKMALNIKTPLLIYHIKGA